MRFKKRYIAFIFFLFSFFLLVFLYWKKPKYDLRYENDCAKQIIQEIQTKKIIFLSENHDEVGSIYFLIKNLESFYEAGVRYIFLEEESDMYLTNPDNFQVILFPPWMQQGTKFQYILLEDKIAQLNKKYALDPLVIIWPETGLNFEESDWADTHQMMNKRDMQAQKIIIDIMDSTEKKGLIFYGNGHGIKKPFEWAPESSEEPYWIPCGFYLNNHYGSDFCSFNIFNLSSDSHRKIIYQNEDDVKILPENILRIILKEDNTEQLFDYYACYPNNTPAVPISYIPTNYIIKAMVQKLLTIKIDPEIEIDPWSNKSEVMLSIYYLKYHLGNKFNFDLTKSVSELEKALLEIDYDDIEDVTYNLKDLEKYMAYLYAVSYGNSIENTYLCMKLAKRINQKDIWPQFHICMIRQLKADEKGKLQDYKKALNGWHELFENELLYSSPVFELACQKAALCADKIDSVNEYEYYKNLERSINPIYKIDYEKYKYFGW